AQVDARVEHQRARDRPVLGELVVELVELHGGAGQGGFQRYALQGAARGLQVVVAGVAGPGQFGAPGVERPRAQRVDVVDDAVWRVAAEGADLVAVDAEQRADGVRFGDRDAKHHLPGGAGGRVLRGVELGV